MELIASSRIVKAQQRVESSRPYAIQLTKAMEDLARQTGSVQHPLLEDRENPSKAGILGGDVGPWTRRRVQRERAEDRRAADPGGP